MLFGSDGDPVLEAIRQSHLPEAPHQLDWRHVVDRTRQAYNWERIDALREYVQSRWDWLFSYREMKRRHPDIPEHLNGTGAMERNIGTVVGHRMKRRGMGSRAQGSRKYHARPPRDGGPHNNLTLLCQSCQHNA